MNVSGARMARRALVVALAAAAAAPAAGAEAYSVAPGWVATDYATGFPHDARTQVGPIGLAFDEHAGLLVTDPAAGALYRIPPGGGRAPEHVLRELRGGNAGLAFDGFGRLFMARADAGDIVQISPASGDQIRVRARGLACPVGLATDPLSGDLFASNVACNAGIVTRVPGSGSPEPYVTGRDIDGITFAPDGTLYASAEDAVLRIDGTDTPSGSRRVEVLARVPGADGIVYSPATPGGDGPFLLVTSRKGTIDRVGLDGSVSTVLSGGSRGDLVTVGPDRCMYATQRDRIVKLGPAQGTCAFATPPPFEPTTSSGDGATAVRGTAARRVVDTAVVLRAPRFVRRGGRAALTVIGRNRSRRPAHLVTVVDTIPRRSRVARIRVSRGVRCALRRRALVCRKRTLVGRASLRVRITVRPRGTARLTNVAAIRSRDLDPAPGNNRARSTTPVRRRAT